jgi:hypothetical protein
MWQLASGKWQVAIHHTKEYSPARVQVALILSSMSHKKEKAWSRYDNLRERARF